MLTCARCQPLTAAVCHLPLPVASDGSRQRADPVPKRAICATPGRSSKTRALGRAIGTADPSADRTRKRRSALSAEREHFRNVKAVNGDYVLSRRRTSPRQLPPTCEPRLVPHGARELRWPRVPPPLGAPDLLQPRGPVTNRSPGSRSLIAKEVSPARSPLAVALGVRSPASAESSN